MKIGSYGKEQIHPNLRVFSNDVNDWVFFSVSEVSSPPEYLICNDFHWNSII
jgi:hypothetical protein